MGIRFDADTLASALVNIYQKKYGNGSQLEPNLLSKTKEILNGAVDKGLSQSQYNPNDAFRDALRHNTNVFSAFRVHKMQSDIASQLLDKDGNLKPFGKFVKDVKPYVSHQNRAWLQTEYDTAVLRAHQAADWQRFEAEKDVLPNLEWMPSTSPDPGADHRPFWNTVLPIDHKFWKIHRPGDRWNCKCQLRNTDKPATQEPGGVIDKSTQPAPGLETNPGEKGEVFSNKHPYFPENCGQCPFNKGIGKLFAALVAKKGNCSKCKKVDEVCEEKVKPITDGREQVIAHRKKIDAHIKEVNKIVTEPHKGKYYRLKNFLTGKTCFRRQCLPDVLTHQIEDYNVKLWILTVKIPKSLSLFRYEGWAHNRLDENKVEKHQDCYGFFYYSLSIKGKTYWANVKVHKSYGEVLYTIEKDKPEDLIEGLPDFWDKIKEQ